MTDTGTSERRRAFAPVVARNTRLLILGSLPGEASLAAGQYYAHPRNQFWHLIATLIDQPDLSALPYADRLHHLRAHRLGLWDAIASARRPGSLDTAIRAAEAAPLAELALTLPDLRAVAFNGTKAAAIGRRELAGAGIDLIDLPSSSPAHAALSLTQKRERWQALQHFLA